MNGRQARAREMKGPRSVPRDRKSEEDLGLTGSRGSEIFIDEAARSCRGSEIFIDEAARSCNMYTAKWEGKRSGGKDGHPPEGCRGSTNTREDRAFPQLAFPRRWAKAETDIWKVSGVLQPRSVPPHGNKGR